MDHITHVVVLTCSNDVMSRTVWPWADIRTTIARRSRIGSFAVREILCSLRPSSMDNGRTNTLGRRATPTSRTRRAASLAGSTSEINYWLTLRVEPLGVPERLGGGELHRLVLRHELGLVVARERDDRTGDRRRDEAGAQGAPEFRARSGGVRGRGAAACTR
jgi:hypothetical protein